MARSKSLLQSDFPYHVTGRSFNKEWFKIPMPVVWHIFSQQLFFSVRAFNFRIHAFVLMENHFHLLVSTPNSNLSKGMEYFMRETTRSLNRESGRINQAFGGPHFRCVVDSPLYYLHCYKYIYFNPVKAGVATTCESYPYSSLNLLLGGSYASFPLAYDDTLFSGIDETLEWLNHPPDESHWDSVAKAVRKKRFRLARVNNSRFQNPLESFKL